MPLPLHQNHMSESADFSIFIADPMLVFETEAIPMPFVDMQARYSCLTGHAGRSDVIVFLGCSHRIANRVLHSQMPKTSFFPYQDMHRAVGLCSDTLERREIAAICADRGHDVAALGPLIRANDIRAGGTSGVGRGSAALRAGRSAASGHQIRCH